MTGPQHRLRLLVVGTGAMGSLLAARLARAGAADVTMAGTWAAALDVIPRRGIMVEEETGRWSVPVATARLSDVGPADFVLVLVKSTATADVAPAAVRALAAGGLIVSLQNGLGNREALERAAGPGRVAVGVATLGATLLAPGHVRAFPGEIVLGSSTTASSVADLIEAFRTAGIEASATGNVDRLVWRKLAVSCAVNPVTALLGQTNAVLLASAESRTRAAAAAREVGAVAAARGIDIGADPAGLALEVAQRTAGNRSSMLQDLDRGARTEIDAFCGAVAAEGRRLGVRTPVNDALWREVRMREGRPVAEPASVAVA